MKMGSLLTVLGGGGGRAEVQISKESPLEEEALVVHAGFDSKVRLQTVFQARVTA